MVKQRIVVKVIVTLDVNAYEDEYGLAFSSASEREEDVRYMVKNSLDNDMEIFKGFLKYEVEGV